MIDRSQVYAAIDNERNYQRKWESTPSGGVHSNAEFLVYIRDYVEEAMHFTSRNPDPAAHEFTMHSLRKIAALAVAAMEQNGVRDRVRASGARTDIDEPSGCPGCGAIAGCCAKYPNCPGAQS